MIACTRSVLYLKLNKQKILPMNIWIYMYYHCNFFLSIGSMAPSY